MKYRLNYTFRGHQITVSVLFGHSSRFYNDDLNNTNMEFGKTITLMMLPRNCLGLKELTYRFFKLHLDIYT